MKIFLIILLLIYQMVDGSQRPMDVMADLTNDLGVCILQLLATMQDGNMAFSPYGIASVSILLFEGATGNSALEILRALNLPWNVLLVRVGFRDMNRHLKTYFKSDGFLKGLIMSREEVCFHQYYQKLLRLYGFEEPEKALTYPCTGFIPYSPTPAMIPVSTIETPTTAGTTPSVTTPAATITTTTADATTPIANAVTSPTTIATEITTVTDDNVVTELTQTSQIITIYNTTTAAAAAATSPLNATENPFSVNSPLASSSTNNVAEIGTATTLRTELTPLTGTFPTTTKMETDFTSSITDLNLSTMPTQLKVNEPSLTTEISTETSQQVTEKVSSLETNVTESYSPSETNVNPKYSSPPALRHLNGTARSNHANGTSLPTRVPRVNNDDFKNELQNFLTEFREQNSTNLNGVLEDLEKSFKFNASATNYTFPNGLLNELLEHPEKWKNTSFSSEFYDFFAKNLSIPAKFNTSTQYFTNFMDFAVPVFNLSNNTSTEFFTNSADFAIPTFNISKKEFRNLDFGSDNDSSIERSDEGASLFSFNYTFFASTPTTQFDFNGTSTLYDTFFNFIENTTQSFKNFIGFGTTPLPDSVSTTDHPLHSPVESITPVSTGPVNVTNEKINATGSRNLNKTEAHSLPKKSISGHNENIVMENDGKKPSAFLNVLSLKQSKLVSTKLNIKGAQLPRKIFKRSKNSESSIKINTAKVEKENNNVLQSNGGNVNNNAKINATGVNNYDKCNSLVQNIHKNSQNSDIFKLTNATKENVSTSGVHIKSRKIRSLNHDGLKNYRAIDFSMNTLDWFTTQNNRMVQVPTFTYSALLPYAYIDELKSKVLELPLDDWKYSLILLLPTQQNGLNHLLSSLTNWPMRKIYRQLQALSVYAIVPKFRVASHVDLKPALYSLGMRDVFQRYRADLSVMSPDSRLFVKSIEQVVTVHVDRFPNAVYEVPEKLTEYYFAASHPFLYFVIDKESKVSLVAGIMADPLEQNVRFF